MPDDNRDQPGQSSSEQVQPPKDPLRRMEERERQMEKQLEEIDEHIRRAKEEQKQKAAESSHES